jgi:hypothetical protein
VEKKIVFENLPILNFGISLTFVTSNFNSVDLFAAWFVSVSGACTVSQSRSRLAELMGQSVPFRLNSTGERDHRWYDQYYNHHLATTTTIAIGVHAPAQQKQFSGLRCDRCPASCELHERLRACMRWPRTSKLCGHRRCLVTSAHRHVATSFAPSSHSYSQYFHVNRVLRSWRRLRHVRPHRQAAALRWV